MKTKWGILCVCVCVLSSFSSAASNYTDASEVEIPIKRRVKNLETDEIYDIEAASKKKRKERERQFRRELYLDCRNGNPNKVLAEFRFFFFFPLCVWGGASLVCIVCVLL